MNIACPECTTIYRVDPDRVPEGGATARCRECGTAFRVDADLGPTEPGEFLTAARWEPAPADTPATPADEPAAAHSGGPAAAPDDAGTEDAGREADDGGDGSPPAPGAPAFGPQDPETRARRLARALVSDIKVYHPEKWEASAQAGTLRGDFREEILKSWEEYVEQVGEEMAKKTPYFRDALNEILAQGEGVF